MEVDDRRKINWIHCFNKCKNIYLGLIYLFTTDSMYIIILFLDFLGKNINTDE